jgi:cytochrome c-type biogenesis protein CcmH
MYRLLQSMLMILVLGHCSLVMAQDQEARISNLETQVISPCCFRQTVDEHQSPAAEKVKGQIREYVAAGKTDAEILNAFIAEYGEAVLPEPRFEGFNMLLLLVIIAVSIYGSVLVVRIVRRWSLKTQTATATEAPINPDYLKKIEEEIERDEG